jgi:hypothetical protein
MNVHNGGGPALEGPDDADGRREEVFRAARRHSQRVRRMKILLPAAALALIAGFVGFAALNGVGLEGASVEQVLIEDGRIVMKNPRVNGLTGDNEPYVVEAARAFQSISNPNDIAMEGITARLPFAKGQFADLRAERGRLDNGSRIMTLDGGFTFVTEGGMTAGQRPDRHGRPQPRDGKAGGHHVGRDAHSRRFDAARRRRRPPCLRPPRAHDGHARLGRRRRQTLSRSQ